MKRARLLSLVLLALSLLFVGGALAQDVVTDDEVNEVAKDIYCPVCESTPLDVCPTAACADWRELIREQLSQGATKQDVFDYFARQYGEGVLADPPRRGISLIVLWVLPVLGILLALILFAWFLRSMRQKSLAAAGAPAVPVAPVAPAAKPGSKPKPAPSELDDYISRIEKELKE